MAEQGIGVSAIMPEPSETTIHIELTPDVGADLGRLRITVWQVEPLLRVALQFQDSKLNH